MPRRRLPRALRVIGLVVVSMVALAGCTRAEIEDNLRFGWPTGITDESEQMRILWSWSCVAALAVGVFVWGLTFWASAFHRKKKDVDDLPTQTAYNVPLELSYTILPFIMIAVLFYYTIVVQNRVVTLDKPVDHSIQVTAFKWNWKFEYDDTAVSSPTGAGGDSGEGDDVSDGSLVETVGTTAEIPVLVLPAGSNVRFTLNSADVIHSFWIPEFLYKLDVIPNGMDSDGTPLPPPIEGTNQFIVAIKDGTEGAYVGRCAELCGVYHAQMNFELRVVSPSQYEDYLAAREAGDSNADALESIGEEPLATSTSPFDPSRVANSS